MNRLYEKLVRAALQLHKDTTPIDNQPSYWLAYSLINANDADFASNIRQVSLQWIEDISLIWLDNLIKTKLGYTEIEEW